MSFQRNITLKACWGAAFARARHLPPLSVEINLSRGTFLQLIESDSCIFEIIRARASAIASLIETKSLSNSLVATIADALPLCESAINSLWTFMYASLGARKLIIVAVVIFFHCLVIVIFQAQNPSESLRNTVKVFTLRLLAPESKIILHQPSEPTASSFQRPEIKILALPSFSIDNEDSVDAAQNAPIQKLQKTREDESIFDPRLRQFLQEHPSQRRAMSRSRMHSWTNNNGITFIDMGDGECISSMQKSVMSAAYNGPHLARNAENWRANE